MVKVRERPSMASSSEPQVDDPNYPSDSAVWLKEKIPAPLLVFSIVGLPIVLYGFIGGLIDRRFDLAATMGFVGLLPWTLIYVNNKGPKVAWD